MLVNTSLENLGLTKNEIEIFTFLLRNGKSTGPTIISHTSIDKGSTYRAIKSLLRKGIITKSGKTRNQVFIPQKPNHLLRLLKNKEEDLKRTRRDLESFIRDIDEYAKENYKSEHIRVYEGHSGYKIWLEQRIKSNIDLIREIAPLRHIQIHFKKYYKFMDKHIAKRVSKNIKLHVLIDSSEKFDHIDRTNERFLKEARKLDAELKLDSVFTTFGLSTGFFSKRDNKFIGIIINDKFITNMLSSMFDFLWKQAKIVK